MTTAEEAIGHVAIVAYDPTWPALFAAEQELLNTSVIPRFIALEHIGSTAVPGQRAKPIIDIMAAIDSLNQSDTVVEKLQGLRYRLIKTGMPGRLFLRKPASSVRPGFHLHIVERETWDDRNERLMRDYLIQHSETVLAYGKLKDKLAAEFTGDSLAYTRAKTAFIQELIDRARDQRGLARVNVWEE